MSTRTKSIAFKVNNTKDTAKNRLEAIEYITSENNINMVVHDKKYLSKIKREKLEILLINASKLIDDVYILAHGYVSKCCKGKGFNRVKEIIKN